MKKPDEIKLWKLLKKHVDNYGIIKTYELIEESGINIKRGYFLIEKWMKRGLLECGTSINNVWFTEKGLKEVFK